MKINLEEIDRLATSARSGGLAAFSQVIRRIVELSEATSGTLWNCGSKPFVPIAHHAERESLKVNFTQNDHEQILAQVVLKSRSAFVKTGTNGIDQESPVLFLVPIQGGNKQVLELMFSAEPSDESAQQFLKELEQVCGALEKLQMPNEPIESSVPSLSSGLPWIELQDFSNYLSLIHASLDRRLTCANIANETRRVLDCDRVSVVLLHRGRFQLTAISGQPTVNHRSNTVQLLDQLATEVLKAKSAFWYPAEGDVAPQIKSILEQYLTVAPTRSLVIHPVLEHQPERLEDPEVNQNSTNRVIGGIVYEHSHQQWVRDDVEPKLSLTTLHGSSALRNSQEHQGLFLYPVWNFLGKSKAFALSKSMPKFWLAILAALGLCLILALWPVEFYVSATGSLVPQHRRLVFPKTEGEVVAVPIDHGQNVQQAELLVELKSDSLQLRLEEIDGRLETLRQRKIAIERSKFQGAGSSSAATVEENLGSLQTEIDSLQRQLESLRAMQSELQVASPMNGQVITWDVRRKLLGRTVTPQNALMEIADVDGPWQLELDVEDRRTEHLIRGLANSEDGKLKVKFTLAADPNQTYEGTIAGIASAIQLNRDNQQMMRVQVDIDEKAIALKQAKTGVSAKIYTGETTSLGYLWLHEIPRTLNRYVFFYLKQ